MDRKWGLNRSKYLPPTSLRQTGLLHADGDLLVVVHQTERRVAVCARLVLAGVLALSVRTHDRRLPRRVLADQQQMQLIILTAH